MRTKIIVLFIVICMYSCKQKNHSNPDQSVSYKYELVKAEKKKSFDLDSETRYNAFFLWWFEDKGKEYLSFLNYRTNQLLFYDFKNCDFLFKTEMEKEGANGVSQISGYYIKNFDNIYLTSYGIPGLVKVDTARNIKQKILYGTTNEGYNIVQSYTPSSSPYIPPVFINNKLFITQLPLPQIHSANQTPVSVVIDTLNHTYEQLPFIFGDVLTEQHYRQGVECSYSREYNGEDFIYSFYTEEYIYVASADHKKIRKINAKSKYIDKMTVEVPPSDPQRAMRWILETPEYGGMIYDKYREVYYRFVYPEVELDPKLDYYQRVFFGRKKFSVIIFDQDFNIIGETLFPENIYNSYVFFVHPDGLYISSDYQINFDKTDEKLNFELFRLTEKE